MRRRRLEADIVTADFLRAVLHCPPVRRMTRLCIGLTREFHVEWCFTGFAQFRGPIIAHTPPRSGDRDSVSPDLTAPLDYWHVQEARRSRGAETSLYPLVDLHTAPLAPREVLRGLPSICDAKNEGDLAMLNSLRYESWRTTGACPRPIGIELRVRANQNFCSLYQCRRPVSPDRLRKLERQLTGQRLINGEAKALFERFGFNLIESQFGRQGFELRSSDLEPFAFDPGLYRGR